MSMLVQQSKRRIPALVGTQAKISVAFAPSSSSTPPSNNNNKNPSPLNPKPPSPPKHSPAPIQHEPEPITLHTNDAINGYNNNINDYNTSEDDLSNSPPISFPTTSSTPIKQYRRIKENAPNVKRVSNERIYHGKSFDSRVEALKHLLTSSHFALLFRTPSTTPAQANRLLEHAQSFNIADAQVFHAYLRFYSRRGNVVEVLRTIDRMRARGIAYSDRERIHIDRAHRRAKIYGGFAQRADVVRGWSLIGDAEMCVKCYDSMRAAGTHPGIYGYTTLLRFFAERGDTEMSSKLLSDMDTLGVNAHTQAGATISGGEETLGLPIFKSLLRFHTGLAEKDVCERLLREMSTRGIEEDEEVRTILTAEPELERDNEEDDNLEFTREQKSKKAKEANPRQPTQFSNPQQHTPNLSNSFTPPNNATQPLSLTQNSHQLHSTTSNSHYTTPIKTDFEIAIEDFEATRKKNGETPTFTLDYYHSLLKMAAQAGDGSACEKVLAAMEAGGITRTQETYAYAIDAQKDNHARCESLFADMRLHGLASPASAYARIAYNTVLWVYCAERRVADAFSLFEEMKDAGMVDTAAYNTLMRVYASDGNLQSVMGLSADMKRRNIPHDISTYNVIVEVLRKFGPKGIVVVDAVVREMEQNNVKRDMVMYDSLLDIYGEAERWEKCEQLWKDMKDKGIILGPGSCARFLEKYCRRDPNLYVKWKKEFSSILPP